MDGVLVECSGHGTCVKPDCTPEQDKVDASCRGKCSCQEGFIGSACDRTDCPLKCSGSNGVCDTDLGVCFCNEVVELINGVPTTIHFTGAGCEERVETPREFLDIAYSNTTSSYEGDLLAKEYAFFAFQLEE